MNSCSASWTGTRVPQKRLAAASVISQLIAMVMAIAASTFIAQTETNTISAIRSRYWVKMALANTPLDLAFSLETVRAFVTQKATDLRTAFDAETAKARQILAQHIHELVLTPRETETGPVYDVSGNIDLFGGDGKAVSLAVEASAGRSAKGKKGVMLMVARAGSNQHSAGVKSVMQVVARDGFVQHYTPLNVPLNGLVLYPAA